MPVGNGKGEISGIHDFKKLSETRLNQNKNNIAEKVEPKSKEEVKRLLGMMSYYRRFIHDFRTNASCLLNISREKVKFE